MQVIRHTPALKPHIYAVSHRIACPRSTRSARKGPPQQQQQNVYILGEQLHGTRQHTHSCEANNLKRNQDVVQLQDVPLIPLKVLLGNPLHSSAKVRTSSSTYACSTCQLHIQRRRHANRQYVTCCCPRIVLWRMLKLQENRFTGAPVSMPMRR